MWALQMEVEIAPFKRLDRHYLPIGSSTSSFSSSHAHSQKILNTVDTSSTSELADPNALSASASRVKR